MFENIKKELYFIKANALLKKGLENGSIAPFDEEFYEKMSHTYFSGLPVSMHIKYLRPIVGPGRCYDRSLYMFFCFKNAVLVRGNTKSLELKYGKDDAGHGWIEMDDYCYCPTLLLKYKKEIYYEIYKPHNVSKTTIDEYKNCSASNRQFYEDVVNTTLNDFLPNGRKRLELGMVIPLIEPIANKDFQKDLENYLNQIKYDEKQIYEETERQMQEILKKKFGIYKERSR